jgi:CHASE3 domain sensor protein
MNTKETRKNIIQAGRKAVNELIKVAEEEIITETGNDDLAADRLKNAAATKKLCIMDAFEILQRIEEEENTLKGLDKPKEVKSFKGFAEGRSK